MAFIKKTRAKLELARGVPMPSVAKGTEPEDLRYEITIDAYKISITEMERDIIISSWAKMAKLHA